MFIDSVNISNTNSKEATDVNFKINCKKKCDEWMK